jgi:hypothetical protein
MFFSFSHKAKIKMGVSFLLSGSASFLFGFHLFYFIFILASTTRNSHSKKWPIPIKFLPEIYNFMTPCTAEIVLSSDFQGNQREQSAQPQRNGRELPRPVCCKVSFFLLQDKQKGAAFQQRLFAYPLWPNRLPPAIHPANYSGIGLP